MTTALSAADTVLTVAVLVLMTAITAVRGAAIRRKRRQARLRPRMEQALAAFLTGGAEPAPAGRDERGVMLEVALDALADLRGSERERLVALLDRLVYTREAVTMLSARSRYARQRAAEMLAAFATPAAAAALRRGLADSDALVRLTCARTIAETGGADMAGEVAAIATRDLPAAPGAAAAVVLALGTRWPRELAPLLETTAPAATRAAAARVAGELRLVELAPALRACLDGSDQLAASAARGLGRIGDVEAVGGLVRLLGDRDRAPDARAAAATALGMTGDPGALPALEAGLAVGCGTRPAAEWPVLAAITEALPQLGEPGTAVLARAASAGQGAVRELAQAAL